MVPLSLSIQSLSMSNWKPVPLLQFSSTLRITKAWSAKLVSCLIPWSWIRGRLAPFGWCSLPARLVAGKAQKANSQQLLRKFCFSLMLFEFILLFL